MKKSQFCGLEMVFQVLEQGHNLSREDVVQFFTRHGFENFEKWSRFQNIYHQT